MIRRVLRHLFTLCAAGSLVLCVAACVLWARSYCVNDTVAWTKFLFEESFDGLEPGVIPADHYRIVSLRAGRGRVAFVTYEQTQDASGGDFYPPFERGADTHAFPVEIEPPYRSSIERLGISCRELSGSGTRIVLPYWLLATLFAAYPAARARTSWCMRRRMRSGRCARCGYDLRASPGRCPECGTAAA